MSSPIDKNSEEWRRQCEARDVLRRFKKQSAMDFHMQEIARIRGQARANQLWDEIKKQKRLQGQHALEL